MIVSLGEGLYSSADDGRLFQTRGPLTLNDRSPNVVLVGGTSSFVQGLFPAGTPGNGVPKVSLTVGTAFPGTK